MKRCLIYFAGAVAAAAVVSLVWPTASQPVAAQSRATATNVPVIPHESVPNFFKNPPGIYTGENMGIATNSKGNIYIYHRAYETRLFEYAPDGKFVREIGRNNYGFAFAHSVRVDAQDNIWAVDEGTDQLVKFSPDGNRVLMVIGRREDPVAMLANMPGGGTFHGRNEKYRFGRQTDVAFDQQGNIFVSDGYFDARVVKYDKNGRFVKAVGTRGNGQPAVQHAAFDRHRLPGQRLRRRPRQRARPGARQRSELEGRTTRTSATRGACACRAAPDRRTPASSTCSRPTRGRTAHPLPAPSITGEVYKMELDGTIVGKFGRGGKALGEFADDPPDGLPRSERHLHGRDQQLALAEDPSEAAGDHREPVRGKPCTHAHGLRGGSGPCARRIARRPDVGSGTRVRHQRRSPQDAAPTSTSARSAASAPTPRARSSSTRGPAIPTRRSATTAPSIAAARGCSSSIRTASSCASSARTSTASTRPTACASIRRTTSGRSTSARTRS